MSHTRWMIYGAAGATGTLIAEEAIRRGHQPLLAGRSAESLASLGKRLGLPWMAIGLDEPGRLKRAVSDVDAVLNAAGPFIATVPPLVQACLAAGTHYLDIAGEIPALQHLFARDQAARERNIALIGGVGFGVVASNSLVKYVADQLPGATTLELAVKADNQQTSQGATKSALEVLAGGGRVYRDGHLVPFRLGKGLKAFRFPDGTFEILPATSKQPIGPPGLPTSPPSFPSGALLPSCSHCCSGVFRSAPFVDGCFGPSRNGGHVSERARLTVREPHMLGHGRWTRTVSR